MAINYRIVRCDNPQGEKEVKYYRPRAVKIDDYSEENLIEDINDSTSVSDVDVIAVLAAISKQLRKAILSGRTVVLDGIGRISIGMDTMSITEEERNAEGFSPSKYIKSLHLNFRPCASILKELRELKTLKYIPEK